MIPASPLRPLRAFSVFAALAWAATFPALVRAEAGATDSSQPPKTWIDPDTGHRVYRITSEPGSASLYFNDHGYTPDGKEMIYTTGGGDIGVVDLTTFATRIVVKGPVQVISVGHRTSTVFFARGTSDPNYSTLWCADLATGTERKLADLPRRGKVFTVNADETLAGGTFIVGDGEDYGSPGTLQVNNLDQPVNKSQMMATRLAARLPMWIYTVDLRTGKTTNLLFGTDWLNHLQFSPNDPGLLMYCHEGQWWHVDRIWTIRTDGTQNTLIHKRTMEMEIAGHEWCSADGQKIWYQLNYLLPVDGGRRFHSPQHFARRDPVLRRRESPEPLDRFDPSDADPRRPHPRDQSDQNRNVQGRAAGQHVQARLQAGAECEFHAGPEVPHLPLEHLQRRHLCLRRRSRESDTLIGRPSRGG
jgi:hypothetical protein